MADTSKSDDVENTIYLTLEKWFDSTADKLAELPACISHIESFLLEKIRDIVVENLSDDATVIDSREFIYFDHVRYAVSVVSDALNHHKLNVSIVPILSRSHDTEILRESIAINSYGAIRQLEIAFPSVFAARISIILRKVETILRSAYHWTAEKLAHAVTISSTQFEVEILRRIRHKFHVQNADSLIGDLMICMVANEKVFYAVDPTQYDIMSARIARSPTYTGLGETRLVAELINCDVPFDKSFSAQALKLRKPLPFAVREAEYKEEKATLQLAQEVAYDEQMCLQLLAERKGRAVLAVYPRKNMPDVESTFQEVSPHIQQIVDYHANQFSLIVRRLRQQSSHDAWLKVIEYSSAALKPWVEGR